MPLFIAPNKKIIKSLAWQSEGSLLAYALADVAEDCRCESLLGIYNLGSKKSAIFKGLKIAGITGWSGGGRFILAQNSYLLKKTF